MEQTDAYLKIFENAIRFQEKETGTVCSRSNDAISYAKYLFERNNCVCVKKGKVQIYIRGGCADCGCMVPGEECPHHDEYVDKDMCLGGTGACDYFVKSNVERYVEHNVCPSCGFDVNGFGFKNFYCPKCGQALKLR